jgi:hypothetical protein
MRIRLKPNRRWILTRREFNLAAAISLGLLIGLLILDDASRSDKQRIALWPLVTRWEMHFDYGSVIVSNQPAWLASENAMDARLGAVDKPHERAKARLQRASDKGQFEEYRQANIALKEVEPEWIANRQRILAQPRVQRRSYDMPIWVLDLLTAILPVVWMRRWLSQRPHVRREIIRPAGILSCFLLMLTLGMIIATVRSYFVAAWWELPVQELKGPVPAIPHLSQIEQQKLVWYRSVEIRLNRGNVTYGEQIGVTAPIRLDERKLRYERREAGLYGMILLAQQKWPEDREWHAPGLQYWSRRYQSSGVSEKLELVLVSGWILLAAWLASTSLWWRYYARRLRAQRRRRSNQCLACGYSMSGNASGVCPECGSQRVVG